MYMPPKPGKRKRTRKSRTAVASDSESSASEQPVSYKSADVEEQEGVDLRESDLSEDEAPVPEIRLGHDAPVPAHVRARTVPEPRNDIKQAEALLDERTRDAFRQLWMQSLTDEFGDELDALRKNDPRFSDADSAAAHLPLLIDALSSGSEVLAGHADQVALVMRETTD